MNAEYYHLFDTAAALHARGEGINCVCFGPAAATALRAWTEGRGIVLTTDTLERDDRGTRKQWTVLRVALGTSTRVIIVHLDDEACAGSTNAVIP